MREVAGEAGETAAWTGRRAFSPCVLEALRRVPRHEFVPPAKSHLAYLNTALPIGHGQTISQPYVVALMTELAEVDAHSQVLEVGTGCGYQAAVLAEIARQVYSVEVVEELARQAAERLRRLGYTNVEVRVGDGYLGWEEHAPYDAILVTAAAPTVPPPLVAQLKEGGRLIMPVGERYADQDLVLLEKDARGAVHTRSVLPVAFVPLTRRT